MRHNVYGRHLGRSTNERTAIFRSLVRALILHKSIQTTQSRAKAIKGLVDKLITKAKESTPASQRVIESFLTQKEISQKLTEEIAPRYKDDRVSGYTSIVRVGRRQGDGAMMVRMSLVGPKKVETVTKIVKEAKEARKEEVKSKGKTQNSKVQVKSKK